MLKEKVAQAGGQCDIRRHFPQFNGNPGDAGAICEFFKRLFVLKVRENHTTGVDCSYAKRGETVTFYREEREEKEIEGRELRD